MESLPIDDEIDPKEIAGLACHNDRSFFWLENGKAYGIGGNSRGQLGVDISTSEWTSWKLLDHVPKPVKGIWAQ